MKPIFKTSNETEQLLNLFMQMPLGSTLSFDDASKAVGFEVRSTLSAYQSAKKLAERDHNIVIDSVRGHGFQRIDGEGMVQRAPRFFKKVRKGARREAHVQGIAITQNLPRDAMLKATENHSRLRILETTASMPKASSNRKKAEVDASITPDNRAALKSLGR
jgi:hypothetical protein